MDPSSYKKGTFFKIWQKFESFHRSFIEYWHTKSQGHKNILYILYKGGSAPAPPTQLGIRVVLLHKRSDR